MTQELDLWQKNKETDVEKYIVRGHSPSDFSNTLLAEVCCLNPEGAVMLVHKCPC